MRRHPDCLRAGLTLGLTVWLALTISAAAPAAKANGYDAAAPPGPRWSNDHHHWEAIATGPACALYPAPDMRADYMPGLDAWGRPIIPLESPRGYGGALPLGGEIDFHLRRMQAGKHGFDIGGYIPLAPDHGPPPPHGPPPRRDCLPDFK